MGSAVAEWIDLPAHLGRDAELLLQVRVAAGGLIDHVDVVRGRLVVHAPAAVGELELAVFNQLLHPVLLLGRLLFPPATEESRLDLHVGTVGVLLQHLRHGVQGTLHAG